MTLDEAFDELSMPDSTPLDAMQVVLDAWGVAAPRCRALLRAFIDGSDVSERTERALFPIVHMLGERCDTAAFADLCALAGDPERAELVLGDATADTLPRILVSCYAGDPAPLRALIERPDADPLIRSDSLEVMAYLTQAKRIPRADMLATLVEFYDSLRPQSDHMIWCGWALAAGMLGFGGLSGRVASLMERGLISPSFMGIEHFHEDLRRAAEDPGSLKEFEFSGRGKLGSAIAALASWNRGDDPSPAVTQTYVNPLRQVGRNDPCPCGSGKKFKKCCLV